MGIKRILKGVVGRTERLLENYHLRKKYPQLKKAFAVDSHLTIPERVELYKLASQADTTVEIGSYIGASACCFGAAGKDNGYGKVVCIDTWQNDAMSEGSRNTLAEFHKNTSEYRDQITCVRGFSTEVIDDVRELTTQIDVMFVDGDHSYEGVKSDWQAYGPLLKSGAIVVFHDYGWAEGVKRVVHEDVLPCVGSHQELPNMWWGQIS